MDRKARIIIAITSVVLVVAIVVSFCLWRQNALKDEGSGKSDTSQTTQQPTDKKTDADAAASDTPTDEDIQVAIRLPKKQTIKRTKRKEEWQKWEMMDSRYNL